MADPTAHRTTCRQSSISGCTLLHALLNLSPLPMAVKDEGLVYQIANTAFCALLGLTPEEVVRRTDADLLPAELAEGAEQWDRMALAEQVPVVFAETWPTPAGDRLFEVNRHPIVNDGTAGSIAVLLTDITEARQTREELDRYVQAVEQSPASVVITDTEGTIEYVNQRFTEVTGYTTDEALGGNPRVLKSGNMAPEVYEDLWSTITAGKEWRGELCNRRKDGTLFWEQVSISPLCDEAGITTHYLAVKNDITEAKAAEEALHRAHRANTLLLATIPSILIGVDDDGRISQWNPAAEHTFAIAAEQVVGRPFKKCRILWHMMKMEEAVATCVTEGKPLRLDDVFFVRPDGRDGLLGITLTPVTGSDGRAEGCLLLASDITDRRHLESQLSQAQKLESIGQLAAGIAHEINTPTQYVGDNIRFLEEAFTDLTTLLTQFQTLLEAARTGTLAPEVVAATDAAIEEADLDYLNDEIPTAIHQSLEGIERVNTIVAAMKEFSHPSQAEKHPTDLNKQIESTITVSRNEWKYVAELTTDLDPNLPPVLCLAAELNQVFLNIIVNAAHAIRDVVGDSGDKGQITVTSRQHGPWVEIRIRDTGSGIPDHARARVFDPFFTTKEVGKGTGQGLSISHSVVVDKHGGTLTFETEMGKGTVFVIRLPLGGGSAPRE